MGDEFLTVHLRSDSGEILTMVDTHHELTNVQQQIRRGQTSVVFRQMVLAIGILPKLAATDGSKIKVVHDQVNHLALRFLDHFDQAEQVRMRLR